MKTLFKILLIIPLLFHAQGVNQGEDDYIRRTSIVIGNETVILHDISVINVKICFIK